MRNICVNIGMLIASSVLATWLRMFDPKLSLETWGDLVGQPTKAWLAAIMASPLFEILYLWPAYLLGSSIFIILSRLNNSNELGKMILVMRGVIAGGIAYVIVFTLTREWLAHGSLYNLKLFIIYVIVGAFYGWAYHYFIIKNDCCRLNKV